jgi:hypothetical protein
MAVTGQSLTLRMSHVYYLGQGLRERSCVKTNRNFGVDPVQCFSQDGQTDEIRAIDQPEPKVQPPKGSFYSNLDADMRKDQLANTIFAKSLKAL